MFPSLTSAFIGVIRGQFVFGNPCARLSAMKAIVFDFDGVIVNTEQWHYESLVAVTRTFGVDFDYEAYLRDYVSFDDRDCFRFALRQGNSDVVAAAARIDDLIARKDRAFSELIRQGVEPVPGVVPIIEAAAAAGVPMAIASGALGHEIMQLLDMLNLGKHFETVVSADMVERSKPDPESFAAAARRLATLHESLNLKPADCLAIEDTPGGLQSARAAGLRTLAVCTTFSADKLTGHADRVVAGFEKVSFAQLQDWFGGE